MALITVRLDRVFDVVYPAGGEKGTMFSIECAGQRHFGITLPGHVTCQDGMIVTAYLERADDWQTLRGWRDHATGEVVCRPAPRMMVVFLGSLACSVPAVLSFTAAPVLSGMLMLACLAVFAGGVHYLRKRSAALMLLRRSTPT